MSSFSISLIRTQRTYLYLYGLENIYMLKISIDLELPFIMKNRLNSDSIKYVTYIHDLFSGCLGLGDQICTEFKTFHPISFSPSDDGWHNLFSIEFFPVFACSINRWAIYQIECLPFKRFRTAIFSASIRSWISDYLVSWSESNDSVNARKF